MYLNVQRAARQLGVSPQTVRRWTASGFLPCTRTAGGHRRIRKEDVEELATRIGGSNHLAARRARERELDMLLDTAVALTGELELAELLKEIAGRLTRLMDCTFCGISSYDASTGTVVMLADYTSTGARLPDTRPYSVERFPLTEAVLKERRSALVNVTDPRADADEVRELRREGDRSLLMVPLVLQGRSIGLLELIDKTRERSYSRWEMRLCGASAGLAAVALHNAETFAALRRRDEEQSALTEAVARLTGMLPDLSRAHDPAAVLAVAARAVCLLPGALSCVATAGEHSAGCTAPAQAASTQAASPAGARAEVVRARMHTASTSLGEGAVNLTVTLSDRADPSGLAAARAYVDHVAALAVMALSRIGS